MQNIILDCDPGYDDAVALLLAAGSPEIRLLAVTTVNFSQTGTHDPPKIHKPIGFIFETRLVRTGESFLFDSSKYYQIYDKIK